MASVLPKCLQHHVATKAVIFPAFVICAVAAYGLLYTELLPMIKTAFSSKSLPEVRNVVVQYKEKHSLHAPGPAVPPSRWVRYPHHKWQGYPLPVLTALPLGRMGNVMGEYSTLWALKHIYNATVFVMPKMRERLMSFPSLSLPICPGKGAETEWTRVGRSGPLNQYNFTKIEMAAAGLFGPKIFLLTRCSFEIQLFNFFKEDLRREFTFDQEIQTKVRAFLAKVLQKRPSDNNRTPPPVLVGFHVRRTDYVRHAMINFGAKLPEDKYFTRALGHYRRRFSNNVAFVVASDDMAFARQRLAHHRDVFFSEGGSPAEDMALLSSCNHSIITLGSYGFWTGYLAGGEVVYPDVKLQRQYRFSREMYETVGLTNFTPISPD
ncbi:galactoside alpha-(1,2)-fucosyltransferase 2-like [Penaeus japonicus]|uniref:galactoside alpha-(1,2)-fucosyltransferase 2-like n=1 Tax=Penaeus japonicus TaxID=27405 RepID=UPI001C70EF99|nr:galactoside alpha-(1,2)-fucosyltransferase 2-like [Penaeus japonicus]